jgi:hypothetical protein
MQDDFCADVRYYAQRQHFVPTSLFFSLLVLIENIIGLEFCELVKH